jgi:fructosamine-3-kinase
MDGFVKTRADAPPGFFAAEAAGLRWLADAGGVRVVRVQDVGAHRIVLEDVRVDRPDAASAFAFGEGLAAMHDAGAEAFGAPPPGWSGPSFIGRREQPSAHESTWGAFYARDRVLYFVDLALRTGGLTAAQADVVRDACALIASGAFDDQDAPARIHGDLWSGNVLWSPEGVVLIDPAAHGGHRETDLAMLALFGCPFPERVHEGYERRHALRPGWRDRIPLHQLHPLAVHAVGHGPAYGAALADAARATVALAEGL